MIWLTLVGYTMLFFHFKNSPPEPRVPWWKTWERMRNP